MYRKGQATCLAFFYSGTTGAKAFCDPVDILVTEILFAVACHEVET